MEALQDPPSTMHKEHHSQVCRRHELKSHPPPVNGTSKAGTTVETQIRHHNIVCCHSTECERPPCALVMSCLHRARTLPGSRHKPLTCSHRHAMVRPHIGFMENAAAAAGTRQLKHKGQTSSDLTRHSYAVQTQGPGRP